MLRFQTLVVDFLEVSFLHFNADIMIGASSESVLIGMTQEVKIHQCCL